VFEKVIERECSIFKKINKGSVLNIFLTLIYGENLIQIMRESILSNKFLNGISHNILSNDGEYFVPYIMLIKNDKKEIDIFI